MVSYIIISHGGVPSKILALPWRENRKTAVGTLLEMCCRNAANRYAYSADWVHIRYRLSVLACCNIFGIQTNYDLGQLYDNYLAEAMELTLYFCMDALPLLRILTHLWASVRGKLSYLPALQCVVEGNWKKTLGSMFIDSVDMSVSKVPLTTSYPVIRLWLASLNTCVR